ncbi:MAG: hypothetical protein ACI8XO_002585 [Verrucomicrobiales bacterium]
MALKTMSGLKEIHLDFHGGGASPGVEKQVLETIAAVRVKTASARSQNSDDKEAE